MKKTREIEVMELREKIFREAVEIFRAWNEPTKLRLLGQRHGRRLKSLECPSIDDFVRSDERLELLHVTTGGRIVLPKDEFAAFVNQMASVSNQDVLTVRSNLLKAFDVRSAW